MISMKINHILIPLCVLVVAIVGSMFTNGGMTWYKTIRLPSWTPSGNIIGAVWTILFILTACSALLFWNKSVIEHQGVFWVIISIFIVNGILNALWSYLFFTRHAIGTSVYEAGTLALSVVALIVLIYPYALLSALLLIPYGAWALFATYLTYNVWLLNK